MRPRGGIITLSSLLLLMLVSACVTPPHSPEGDYYLASDMTYIRDAAAFDSNVIGQLYKGDQVEKLETGPSGWWRVRSGRTGQIGWVTGDLFSLNQVPVSLFYVTRTVNLRECPKDICASLQLLSRGDRVQKIEQNDQGWWRVLVADSRNLGWLPADALAESLEKAQARPAKPYLYVAVRRLKLYRVPQTGTEVVKLLQVNDQVEKTAEGSAGWIRVRQPASGASGWVQSRYLESLPVTFPRGVKRKKSVPQPSKPVETAPPGGPEIM